MRRILRENIRNEEVSYSQKLKCEFILDDSEGKRKSERKVELLCVIPVALQKSSLMNKWDLNKENYRLYFQLQLIYCKLILI